MSSDLYKTIILQSPGFMIWKNIDLIYQGANTNFIELIGLNTTGEVIGKSDFDMPWAKSHAKQYREDDFEVLSGIKKFNYIETQMLKNNRLMQVIVNKVPIYSEQGEIIGLICNYNEFKLPAHLTSLQKLYQLTKKQTDCLNYIVMGLTAKEIARKMDLSPRTVEAYTEVLKYKLNCHSKYQLIQKTLSQTNAKTTLLY